MGNLIKLKEMRKKQINNARTYKQESYLRNRKGENIINEG
jgi:hypothetical protein